MPSIRERYKAKRHLRSPHLIRYPRSNVVRFIRGVFLCCWGIIIYYVGNALWNLYLLLHSGQGFPDSKALIEALVLPVQISPHGLPAWIYVAIAVPFWPILVGCFWASRDLQREAKSQQQQEILKTVENTLADEAEPTIELKSPFLILTPPLDIGRLPNPDVFINRPEHLSWLKEMLLSRHGQGAILLYGMPGVGKTALAAIAIRQLYDAGHFHDGVIVHSCQGQTDATEILRKVLARFDPQPHTSEMTNWTDRVRHLLAGKAVLIVLDNVEADTNIESIMAPFRATRTTILITARHKFVQTQIAKKIGQLSPQEALDLFVQPLERRLTQLTVVQRAAATTIVKALGYHALAVKLAGAQAAYRDIEILASELQDPQRAINLPSGETPRVVALVFNECINDLRPKTKRLFIALAAFSSLEFSRTAVLTLGENLGLASVDFDVDFHLHTLITRALIETSSIDSMPVKSDRERLSLHPLLHAFASQLFARWPRKDREIAYATLAHYYADYTNRTHPSLLNKDEMNITGALKWAHEQKEQALVVTLCTGMRSYWFQSPLISDQQHYLRWGLDAAADVVTMTQTSNDFLREANLTLTHAQMLQREGKIDEAKKIYMKNLQFRRSIKDQHGESEVLTYLVQIELQRGYLQEAENFYEQTLNVTRKGNDTHNEGIILGCVSDLARRRGRLEDAEKYSKESLKALRAVKDQRNEAASLIRLGNIAQDSEHFHEARNYYEEALKIIHAIQDRQSEGWLYYHIGDLALATGHIKKAEEYSRNALLIMQRVQDKRGEAWTLGNLGSHAHEQKNFTLADDYYQKARKIMREVQDRHGEGWLLKKMGDLALARHREKETESYYRLALQMTQDVEDLLNYARTALAFGTLLSTQNRQGDEAGSLLKEAKDIFSSLGLPGEEKVRQAARNLRGV